MQNYLPQMRNYRAIPVSSEAEMNNITVDFNGTPTYFHNQNLNEIYVKQFDIKTGLTSIQKFIKADGTETAENDKNGHIDIKTLEENLTALNERVNSLSEIIENQKGGKR